MDLYTKISIDITKRSLNGEIGIAEHLKLSGLLLLVGLPYTLGYTFIVNPLLMFAVMSFAVTTTYIQYGSEMLEPATVLALLKMYGLMGVLVAILFVIGIIVRRWGIKLLLKCFPQ